MQMQHLRRRMLACLASLVLAAFSAGAVADPPSRVARLGYMSGPVSFSPSGEDTWDQATLNRPLSNGDRLWSDAGGRAEIQVGGATVRLNANTGVSVLNMDDRIAQLQLTQGVLNVRVRRLPQNQVFEVDTPNLAFTLRQPGDYRIEVDPDGNATTILMRSGQGEVYGEGTSYLIDAGQPYRFTGTDLRQEQLIAAPRADDFDRWASDRDRLYDNSISARYVSPDVVGLQDLDAHGRWRVDATYGNVWTPNHVAVGWAPYRDGHWAWVYPWGWTWVDDAPWGFAVSHYGRWANIGGSWGWVPGPVGMPAYYAPALVAFVGGANFQLTISSGNVGGVAWFPLAPREVYRPSYAVSRGYFERVNSSNTVINNTIIQNTYNTTNVTNVVYANRSVPGAVVAVPTTTFVQSRPVAKAAVPVNRTIVASAPVAPRPAVAPTEKSVRGAAAQGDKPPARVFDRVAVAHAAPPAPQAGFAAQQPGLPAQQPQQSGAQPGKPLDNPSPRTELKRAPAAAAPQVKVVAQAQQAPPTQRPPATAQGNAPPSADARSNERKVAPSAPEVSTAPAAPPPAVPSPAAAPPAATPQAAAPKATPAVPRAQTPDEDRAKPERQPNGQARGQDEMPAQSRAPSPPQSPAVPPPAEPRAAVPPTQAPPRQAAQPRMASPPAPPTAVPPPTAAAPAVASPRSSPATQSAPVPPPAEPRATAPTQAAPRQAAQPRMPPPTDQPPAVTPPTAAAPVVTPPRPSAVPPPQAQRARPEPAPAVRPPEAGGPVAAPTPVPRQAPPQAASKAQPQSPQPRAAAGKPNDKGGSENKSDEPDGKQKG